VPKSAKIMVAEILPIVVLWNRSELAHLAGFPLEDSRVAVVERDVAEIIASGPSAFDAVLLDVDNGPAALTVDVNERLYGASGLAAIRRCLRPGGVLGVWSADPDRAFERRLAKAGFRVSTQTVPARKGGKGPKHTIFIAYMK
jgi:spermidine synthase